LDFYWCIFFVGDLLQDVPFYLNPFLLSIMFLKKSSVAER